MSARTVRRLATVVTAALALLACAPAAHAPAGVVATAAPAEPDPFDGSSILAEPTIVVTEAMGSPHPGDAAPDFELTDQDGKRFTLASARGAVVVVAFVAAFCPFSKAEQPALKELAAAYAGKGVRVVAIDIKEPEADYREYVGRMKMGLPVLRDEQGTVASRFTPARAQPELQDRAMALVTSNLVIDRQGKIRFFTVLDTVHFDSKLVHLRRALDQVVAERGS